MPGLAETTAMLARLRKASGPSPLMTAGNRTLVETVGFGENLGALKMLSHAPKGLASGAPLVVVLHGCAQTAESYAVNGGWIALADRLGFAVLAPEQVATNNPNRCFNWFEPGDTARGRGEAASIAAMVAAAIQAHDCDPRRVFITGLSAGGAMTAAMLATYPDLFAGGAVIAGLAHGVARGVPDALRVMGRGDGRGAEALGDLVQRGDATALRLAIWHGDADYTVNAANAQDLTRQWTSATGLSEAPSEVVRLGARTRSVWRDDANSSIIELNIVHGLGHGTPLATKGEGDVGQPAPYMLEAGLSSTLEIAGFWGLGAESAPAKVTTPTALVAPKSGEAKSRPPTDENPTGVAAQVLNAVSSHVSPGVRDVIEKALRAAGLMR
ncbi:extracellular catalytic domain type 1 short-chain-length polyhydroxyalkanoate depolymerase [Caulobacter sp. DWR1-3-2b1]|uniref:extracellular catalytic domain type 1 short-chain-length polyhydroxyalkanoate depolymerase n=1 Tax=Caulobacter sp. DWR1-3-2b1 TaxID=2804670 RepID=UPI003CE6F191